MNKYYTPKIEELCVGFRCEYKMLKGFWKPIICDSEILSLIFEDLLKGNDYFISSCRVKFLDREDIESLGFIHIDGSNDCRYFKEDKYGRKYRLCFGPTLNGYGVVSIDVGVEDFPHEKPIQIFRGIIKNRSELERLFKQLNIK